MKKALSILAVSVTAVSAILASALPAAAVAQTCTWTGTAGDNKFSTAGNWSGCGSAAPLAGDIIQLNTKAGTSMINIDNTGVTTALGGVVSTGTDATAYRLSDSLTLQDGATWDVQESAYIGYVSSNTSAKTIAQGSVTLVNGYMPKISMTTGTLTVKNGASLADMDNIGTPTGIIVESGASIDCLAHLANPTISIPLTLGGGTSTTPPIITFEACSGGGLPVSSALTLTIAKVTLLADAKVNVFGSDKVTITDLVANGHTISLAAGADGTLVTPLGTQTVTYEPKTTQLDGDKPTENVVVNPKETAILNGTRCTITVKDQGVLKGVGELCSLYLAVGAAVAPGNSPGTITMSGPLMMSPGSTYTVEILNKDSYDKLVAESSEVSDAVLDVKFLAGAKVAVGDTYTIISNTGTGSIIGTFKDLAEGATFKVSSGTFKITYKGGDGNDVVLTVQEKPTVPDTGFELVRSNPAVTLGVATLGAVMIAFFARSRSNARR